MSIKKEQNKLGHRIIRLCQIITMLTLIIFFNSCKPVVPKGVLSESKMEQVLYDYHIAQAMGDSPNDSAEFKKEEYIDEAFRKNGTTEAEFDSSLVWYMRHADRLHDIYDRINKRMTKSTQALGGLVAQSHIYSDENGGMQDTTNLWSGQKFYALTPIGFNNRITFTIKADSSFHRQDRYMWQFSTQFLYREGAKNAIAGLIIRYANDSVVAKTTQIFGSNTTQLDIETDSTSDVKEISGFIYMNIPESDIKFGGYKVMFIEQPSLIRFRKTQLNKKNTVNATQSDTMKKQNVVPSQPQQTDTNNRPRLSPVQFRESQPVEHKLDIVKEKAYRPVRRNYQRRH